MKKAFGNAHIAIGRTGADDERSKARIFLIRRVDITLKTRKAHIDRLAREIGAETFTAYPDIQTNVMAVSRDGWIMERIILTDSLRKFPATGNRPSFLRGNDTVQHYTDPGYLEAHRRIRPAARNTETVYY